MAARHRSEHIRFSELWIFCCCCFSSFAMTLLLSPPCSCTHSGVIHRNMLCHPSTQCNAFYYCFNLQRVIVAGVVKRGRHEHLIACCDKQIKILRQCNFSGCCCWPFRVYVYPQFVIPVRFPPAPDPPPTVNGWTMVFPSSCVCVN